MTETLSLIRVVTLLCVQQNRVLLVRKQGSAYWMLPGGKPDENEAPLKTLQREVQEELGVDVVESRWFGRFSAPAANEAGFTVQAEVYCAALTGPAQASAEIAEVCWFDLNQLDSAKLAPLLREHILPALVSRRSEG